MNNIRQDMFSETYTGVPLRKAFLKVLSMSLRDSLWDHIGAVLSDLIENFRGMDI